MSKHRHFEAVVAAFSPDLFRFAFWLCRDRTLAEDIVQETLLRAWKSLHKLRDEGSAKHWLLTIVRREHARTFERKRLPTVDIDAPGLVDEQLGTRDWDTDMEDMRRAIFQLEDDYREPLVLQVLVGYSTQEIADLMGLTQGAVLTRLFRARKQLKGIMDKRGAGVRQGNRS